MSSTCLGVTMPFRGKSFKRVREVIPNALEQKEVDHSDCVVPSRKLMEKGGTLRPARFIVYDPNNPKYAKLHKLVTVLLKWINCALRERRVQVVDLFADLWDGRVILELIEELGDLGSSLDRRDLLMVNDRGRQLKWNNAIKHVNHLGITSLRSEGLPRAFSVEALLSYDPLALIHLVLAVAEWSPSDKPTLPADVSAQVLISVPSAKGMQIIEQYFERLTVDDRCTYMQLEDFRTGDSYKLTAGQIRTQLAEHLGWLNARMARLGISLKSIRELTNGVIIILFAALEGGYFVHMKHYHRSPDLTVEEKLENWELAMSLLEDGGVAEERLQPFGQSINNLAECEEVIVLDFLKLLREHFNRTAVQRA